MVDLAYNEALRDKYAPGVTLAHEQQHDFAPGIARARSLGKKVDAVPYRGIPHSIEVLCQKIREARKDPDLTGWAGDVLIAAGRPKSVKLQVQAMLDTFRQNTVYAPDAIMAERIASPAATLCLRKDLCVRVRDCDDGVVAIGGACLAVGIPVQVVKQKFGKGDQEHVLLVCQDELGQWFYADPGGNLAASDPLTGYAVGESAKATEEVWMDPLGDIPGIGRAEAEMVTFGALPDGPRECVEKNGAWFEKRYGAWWKHDAKHGWIRAASPHAIVAVGMGGAPLGPARVATLGADKSLEPVAGAGYDAALFQVNTTLQGLAQATAYLDAALQRQLEFRSATRPNDFFDPEPATPITSLADFPTDGTWTFSMATIAEDLYRRCDRAVKALKEAVAGGRRIIVSPEGLAVVRAGASIVPGGAIMIEALDTDTERFVKAAQGVKETVIGVYNQAGDLIEGFYRSGEKLTKGAVEAIQAAAAATLGASSQAGRWARIHEAAECPLCGTYAWHLAKQDAVQIGTGFHHPACPILRNVGTGVAPVVVVAIVLGIAIVAYEVSACLVMRDQAATARVIAENATTQSLANCVGEGRCSEEFAYKIKIATDEGAAAYERAKNEGDISGTVNQLGNTALKIFAGLAVVAAVGTGIYLGAPLVKKMIDKADKKKAA